MTVSSNKLLGVLSFLLALLISSAVFYAASRSGYVELRSNATAEARKVVAITSGFVRTYSEYQSRYAKGLLPTPAEFRADALGRTDETILDHGGATSVIGLPGREISNSANDEAMRSQMIKLEQEPNTDVLESVHKYNDQTTHRSLFPFFATEPTCAACHNRLQNLTGDDRWQVGDLMGAQYVDQNIDPQLANLRRDVWLLSTLAFLASVAVFYCFLFLIRQFQLGRELKRLATTDSMTGCINRREMYDRINAITGKANGVLLMLDLDRFKSINDTHGHAAGDAVIQDFSQRLKDSLRGDDWVARIGGEEFVAWLPDAKPQSALLIAERLRKTIESSPLRFEETKINYTVSIGLHPVKNSPPSTLDAWIKAADELLYRAKKEGRNRIVFQKELMA